MAQAMPTDNSIEKYKKWNKALLLQKDRKMSKQPWPISAIGKAAQ